MREREINVNLYKIIVAANGSLVVGQEQDRLGGGFSESEAFLGKLSLLDMWDVILDGGKIATLWHGCERYRGNVVAWARMRQYVHGDVAVIMRTVSTSYSEARPSRELDPSDCDRL